MAGDAPAIYLASASPRRSELLRQIDVTHEVRPVDIDESPRPGEKPAHYALRLAEEKARALWERLPLAERRPVLARQEQSRGTCEDPLRPDCPRRDGRKDEPRHRSGPLH